MSRLENGQTFPTLSLHQSGGGDLNLPGDVAGGYGVVLVYRGAWCPYCNAQLASYQRAAEKLKAAGIKVAALSVDDEATTQSLIEKHRLEFPIAHSVDANDIAAKIGSYTSDSDPLFLQSTGFVLDPDGKVVTALYSSGAIGRLVPDDVLGLVSYHQKNA